MISTDKGIEYSTSVEEYAAKKFGQKLLEMSGKSTIERVKQMLKDRDICSC